MFINLQQTSEDIANSQELVAHVDIGAIKLLTAQASRKPHSIITALNAQLAVNISFRAKKLVRVQSQLISEIEFACHIAPVTPENAADGSEQPDDLVRIDCSIEAVYNLLGEYSPTEEQCNAFLQGNAVFNCWPFFREFVQNCAARMEIPAPPIPFLRVSLKQADIVPTTETD